MTNNNNLITPPPELVQQWQKAWEQSGNEVPASLSEYVATQAARWGADQELEACEKYWMTHGISPEGVVRMREARRPKPPNLKERALEALNKIEDNKATYLDSSIVRRALEQLND